VARSLLAVPPCEPPRNDKLCRDRECVLAKLRDLYETPLAALPEASAPDLKNKSFTIALRKFLRTAQKA